MGGTIMTLKEIDEYAYKHYEQGGDIIVECMDNEEKLARFETLSNLKEYIEINEERRQEIEITAW
jgi:precorrin-6B methylase 2